MPSWIARPIVNGINACDSIQSTPNDMPPFSVPIWWRPTQTSSRNGDRVSGMPGSSNGRRITGRF